MCFTFSVSTFTHLHLYICITRLTDIKLDDARFELKTHWETSGGEFPQDINRCFSLKFWLPYWWVPLTRDITRIQRQGGHSPQGCKKELAYIVSAETFCQTKFSFIHFNICCSKSSSYLAHFLFSDNKCYHCCFLICYPFKWINVHEQT